MPVSVCITLIVGGLVVAKVAVHTPRAMVGGICCGVILVLAGVFGLFGIMEGNI